MKRDGSAWRALTPESAPGWSHVAVSRSRLYGLVVSTVLGNCAATPEPAVPDECLTPPDAAVSSADGAAEPPDDASEALLSLKAAEPGGPELARP